MDIKETLKEATREKNANEPNNPELVDKKVQSDRFPPKVTKGVDADGKVKDVGSPDGGVEGDRFIEQHRNDPPTH